MGTMIKYEVITKDVSDYINLLVRIAHIICNHPLYKMLAGRPEGYGVHGRKY
jgi:hypothetical protein